MSTDKSKRFSVLTNDQYIKSGMLHTQKDKEIQFEDIKHIQSYVNEHCRWLVNIFKISSEWDQTERMQRNVRDKGEQVCPMSLLLKDHKEWS